MNLVGQKNKALRAISTEVAKGDDVIQIIGQMLNLAQKNKGIGLAANQVGITKRIIVLNTKNHQIGIVNPVISKKWPHRAKSQEGCLSYPGLFVRKNRHKRITVTGFNAYWEPIEIKAKGIDAIVLQHEIDHLNGITIGQYQ